MEKKLLKNKTDMLRTSGKSALLTIFDIPV